MNAMHARERRWVALMPVAVGAVLQAAPLPAHADYFSLYLKCDGQVASGAGRSDATLELALRDNNQSALIQRSNVLPVGEKLRYEVSPAAYSMTYRAPNARTPLYYDWLRGQLFTWDPALKRLARIRLSIDRQSGALDGDIVNSDDQSLARIGMTCRKADPRDLAPPKF